jgi:hypothetical protein
MPRQRKGTPKTQAAPESRATRTPGNPDKEGIGALAYELWLRRGCPIGSPQEDWFQAERALSGRNEPESTAP